MPNESLVICRSATHFLRLGYVKGYRCQFCGAELQASPSAVDQIAAGGIPACRVCGDAEESRRQAKRDLIEMRDRRRAENAS